MENEYLMRKAFKYELLRDVTIVKNMNQNYI